MVQWVPSVFMFLLAAGLGWHSVRQWRAAKDAEREGNASLAWPKTTARIVASQAYLESTGDSEMPAFWLPSVSYQYEVAGTTYSGTKIAVRDLQSYRKSAEAIVARYPAGSEVQVSYDPQSPQSSLLEPGAAGTRRMYGMAWISIVVSVLMFAAGIVVPILKGGQ